MITKLGVTVKILFDKYNKQLEGKIGTVERLYDYGKVGVKIEGCCNNRSSYEKLLTHTHTHTMKRGDEKCPSSKGT